MKRVEDLKLKRISLWELPTGTVAQLVRASAQQAEDLGSIPSECTILICSVVFFLLCYSGEALEHPILTWVCTIIMLIKKDIEIKIPHIYIMWFSSAEGTGKKAML